jgi:hypothetical protein
MTTATLGDALFHVNPVPFLEQTAPIQLIFPGTHAKLRLQTDIMSV